MSELKAFVGHSFAVDDEDTIRPILEYLNQIQEMNLGFSWENAKPAEPRELAEKVLSLIEDKNLFIGICTKKEIVTDYGNLEKKLFSRGYVCAREENISWKTSDWIIQEIGLAIGRKMEVILLIEHGVQKPGGLQGDLEYIEFSRESPEKSFVKILEMNPSAITESEKKLIQVQQKIRKPLKKRVQLKRKKTGWRHLQIGREKIMRLHFFIQ